MLAGPPGVEPGIKVLETSVIPFHHGPIYYGAWGENRTLDFFLTFDAIESKANYRSNGREYMLPKPTIVTFYTIWSLGRESNSRLLPYHGSVLPLNYPGITFLVILAYHDLVNNNSRKI